MFEILFRKKTDGGALSKAFWDMVRDRIARAKFGRCKIQKMKANLQKFVW